MSLTQRNLIRCLLATLIGAALWHTPARAEWSASLPAPAACTTPDQPTLPVRWHAVGLMMPFLKGQLDVGEFVYDGTVKAMRATVYGLESGAVDLLITDRDTYRLDGPYAAPNRCESLGRKLKLPSDRWMSEKAVCVGEMQLAAQPVRWWKGPGAEGQAKLHWFTRQTRLPWRSMFLSRSLEHTVVGDYAMTYFPTFTPVQDTKLAGLVDLCRNAAPGRRVVAPASIPTARQLMAIRNEAAEAERTRRIETLIPGLSHGACSRMTKVKWPDQFVMTAMITPIRFDEAPYSSMIYYDWRDAETQLALMFQGRTPQLKGLVSLKKRVGYRIETHPAGGASCQAVFPGIVRPDWMSVANCECKGVIDAHTPLSTNAEMQILSCPIKGKGDRIMWNWYTANGRPMLFFEAAPSGGGVMLADYHDWLPGKTAPQASVFNLPPMCPAPSAATHLTLSSSSCSECHTTAPH